MKAVQNGTTKRQASTDASGFYRMQLPVGTYTIEASKTNYETGTANVVITENQTVTQDFSLRTARGEVTPPSLEFVLQRNMTQTKTLTLSNTRQSADDVGRQGVGRRCCNAVSRQARSCTGSS